MHDPSSSAISSKGKRSLEIHSLKQRKLQDVMEDESFREEDDAEYGYGGDVEMVEQNTLLNDASRATSNITTTITTTHNPWQKLPIRNTERRMHSREESSLWC